MKIERQEAAPAHYAQLIALFVLGLLFALASWLSSLPKSSVFPQWDKIVHTTAGISLAIAFLPHIRKSAAIVFIVFLLAALYEIVEFFIVPIAEYGSWNAYYIDTLVDLIVATVGAWVMLKLIRKYYG